MPEDPMIAKVVHIATETHEKFVKLGADEDLRQMVQAAGFSIKLEFGKTVTVWNTECGYTNSAEGETLSEAMYRFIKANRGFQIDADLRAIVIRRFRAECPHPTDKRRPGNHGAGWICGVCGGNADKQQDA